MSEIAQEIATQPACWRLAAALAPEIADALPTRGSRVAAVGCGTSLYVARAVAALRESAGQGETDAFAASEFPRDRRYDVVIAISRSGTTTEVLRLLETLAETRTVTVTADPGTPAARLADHAVVLDFAEERSVVQTRFATSTLALARSWLGEDLSACIADGERAIGVEAVADPGAFARFTFLGHGWSVGIAEEAGLKLREAARADAEAYPAMEFRHGPISRCDERSLVWILGSPDPSIARDVGATGATVRLAELDPMAELVIAQRMAVEIAERRGYEPDRPRHLTRSVVLSGPS